MDRCLVQCKHIFAHFFGTKCRKPVDTVWSKQYDLWTTYIQLCSEMHRISVFEMWSEFYFAGFMSANLATVMAGAGYRRILFCITIYLFTPNSDTEELTGAD